MSSLIKVFVFGTLRPSEYNHTVIEPAVRKIEFDVTTQGRMYYVYDAYPCVRFSEEGIVTGDLLWVDSDSYCYGLTHDMEIGAGYTPRRIKVKTSYGIEEAIAYDWPKERRCGERIATGNWKTREAKIY